MLLWLKWDMDSLQVHRRVFIWRSTYKHLCLLINARRTFANTVTYIVGTGQRMGSLPMHSSRL